MTVKRRLPEWFKVPMPGGPNYMRLRNLMRAEQLHKCAKKLTVRTSATAGSAARRPS